MNTSLVFIGTFSFLFGADNKNVLIQLIDQCSNGIQFVFLLHICFRDFYC
jgi:hypothetical protein